MLQEGSVLRRSLGVDADSPPEVLLDSANPETPGSVGVLLALGARKEDEMRRSGSKRCVCVLSALLVAGLSGSCSSSEDQPRRGGTGASISPPAPAVPGAVVIPTSVWRPGDGELRALLSGRLDLEDPSCPVLRTRGSRFALVWPQGFYATTAGRTEIHRADGALVARDGERFTSAGGSSESTFPACPPGISYLTITDELVTR